MDEQPTIGAETLTLELITIRERYDTATRDRIEAAIEGGALLLKAKADAKHGDFLPMLNPNPPKDTDGRREDSGRGWVRELQGRWPGVGVDGRPADGLQSPHRAP